MTHQRLIPATCALTLLLLTTLPAHATTFWNEGFEFSDNTAWLAPGTGWVDSACTPAKHAGIMEISSDRAFRGKKSLKFTYIGFLSATVPNVTCYLDRYHTRTPELYTRRYVYLDNFHGTSPPSKMMFTGENAYTNFWSVLEGTNNLHRYNLQGSALPIAQQNPSFGNVLIGRWVCIETHTKMNTPGVANGILEEWMDGVLRYSNTALIINSANQNTQHKFVRLYRQHGNGVIYLDELALGDTRIGCLGAPSTDTTPPKSPSNFVAN